MPNTSNMEIGQTGRTPIAARTAAVFFVAYPTGYPSLNRVRVWRVGPRASARRQGHRGRGATVAGGRNGRMWVVWEGRQAGRPMSTVALNPAGTRLGRESARDTPSARPARTHVDASPVGGFALDVVDAFALGSGSPLATYHRRIYPV